MRKASAIAILLILSICLVPASGFAAEKFGMIFDIEGNAVLEKTSGKTITIGDSCGWLCSPCSPVAPPRYSPWKVMKMARNM